MKEKKEHKRVVTDEDIKKYIPLVNKWLRDSVVKNWNEATLNKNDDEVTLGNTGMTMSDIRSHLYAEVVVALQEYNPDYRTKEGKSVKEFTFVYRHLYFRVGQMMKKLTKRSCGYGIWNSSIDDLLNESNSGDEY